MPLRSSLTTAPLFDPAPDPAPDRLPGDRVVSGEKGGGR